MNPLLWALLGVGVLSAAAGAVIASQKAAPSTTNPPVPAGTPAPTAPWTPPPQSVTATTSSYPSTAALASGAGAVTNVATVPQGGVAVVTYSGTVGAVTPSPSNAANGQTAPTVTTSPSAISFATNGGGTFSYTVTWTDAQGAAQTTTVVVYAVN